MRCLIFILLVAVQSHAGVRTVGNGGGYAEMQATLINNELVSWTKACLLNSNPCGLSSTEAKDLAATLRHSMNLGFQTSCTGSPVILKDALNVEIESCALYRYPQPVAKDFSEIAVLVLSANLMTVPGMSFSDAAALSSKIFHGYTQSEQQLAVILSESETLMHSLQIFKGTESFNLISLEGRSQTVDISNLIKDTLTCDDSEVAHWNVNVIASRELSPVKALVDLDTSWRCRDQRSYAAILQVVYSTSQSEILPQTIGTRLVHRVAR